MSFCCADLFKLKHFKQVRLAAGERGTLPPNFLAVYLYNANYIAMAARRRIAVYLKRRTRYG